MFIFSRTWPVSLSQPPAVPTQDDVPIELQMMLKNEQELASLARQHGVQFATESSVAPGGTPAPAAVPAERPARSETTGRGRGRGRGRGSKAAAIRAASASEEFEFEASSEQKSQEIEVLSQAAKQVLGPRENVLWKIGDEQFGRECRRQKCINFAGEKVRASS